MSTKFTLQILFISLLLLAVSPAQGDIDWMDQANWGGDCDGTQQTPIDIDPKKVEFCPWQFHFEMNAPCKDFQYMEEGQSLTVAAEGTNYLTMYQYDEDMNKTELAIFEAAQFHFHTPSEHHIDGMEYDLQMHLVHVYSENITSMYINESNMMLPTEDEYYAVVGIFFKEDHFVEEDVFDSFIPSGNETMSNILQSFQCIAERFFYHYKGSLTTPPCTEAVEWFLLRDPLPIRPENLKRFKHDINNGMDNARHIQDLHDREVILTSPSMCYDMGYMHDDMIWDKDEDMEYDMDGMNGDMDY